MALGLQPESSAPTPLATCRSAYRLASGQSPPPDALHADPTVAENAAGEAAAVGAKRREARHEAAGGGLDGVDDARHGPGGVGHEHDVDWRLVDVHAQALVVGPLGADVPEAKAPWEPGPHNPRLHEASGQRH
eukprot:68452-Chlamydomonas_euryale.AAC.1